MPIHDWTRVDAGIFHHFHQEWMSATARVLNRGLLPPDYYALTEQVAGGLHPDVLPLERSGGASWPVAGNGGDKGTNGGGGVALAMAPPQVRFTAVAEAEVYSSKCDRIAIRHSSGDQVIAVMEIVSPGNKASRHELRSFVDKAIEFLNAGIHLLIIDLFPPGPRDPQGIHGVIRSEIVEDNFHLPADRPLTLVSYSAGYIKRAFIEPVAVAIDLPPMPLFLEAGFYVPVPLEATYVTAFEALPKRWRDELERADVKE